MTQNLIKVTIRELVEGYTHNGVENDEAAVLAYDGNLTIRPEYQREFVYSEDKKEAVIKTILKNGCLSFFTWAKEEDRYECLDGQQRTISICEFIDNKFSVALNKNDIVRYQWDNMREEERESILNQVIYVNVVEGTEEEKISWFHTINISSEPLRDQELRNSIYFGTWLSSAKSYFSRRNCVAKKKYEGYISGDPTRQDILEKAIRWMTLNKVEGSKGSDEDINKYMSEHRKDENANSLWTFYQIVMDWAKKYFAPDEKLLKTQNQDWGRLYKDYHEKKFNPEYTRKRAHELLENEDITNNKGIIEYILSGEENEKYLNIRAFDDKVKKIKWDEQNHTCACCGKEINFDEARGDHVKPWKLGGKTEYSNLQILCQDCNARKSAKY